jgi:AmmeMemoRadiSam system protein B
MFLRKYNQSIYLQELRIMTKPIVRVASHAGSWYSNIPETLHNQIDRFFQSSSESVVKGARVLVGPHAGYAYSGSILANAYKSFDTTGIERVFILGPSHHVYFKGCVLTTNCDFYDTPFGKLKVDTEIINELVEYDSKVFKRMSLNVDEDEHSLEMHMPFLYKVTNEIGKNVKIIPIMIGASDEEFELKIANYLKPYFQDKSNAFIVSTDFCHWGSRFSYTLYTPTGSLTDLKEIKKNKVFSSSSLPIYKSIEVLDKEAMKIMETGSYRSFKDYIYLTENTICGAKPLSILMLLMQDFIKDKSLNTLHFNGYDQSSNVVSSEDSSVSYGSAYAVI